MSRPRNIFICAAAALLLASPALAAGYEAELDPVPFDAVNRADVIDSIGNVTATLDGGTLTIHGSFSNLTSNATGGSFRIGLAKNLASIPHIDATKALARLAIFSAEYEVRAAAIEALKTRGNKDYTDILMQGFRYPLPAVSKRAAEALDVLRGGARCGSVAGSRECFAQDAKCIGRACSLASHGSI